MYIEPSTVADMAAQIHDDRQNGTSTVSNTLANQDDRFNESEWLAETIRNLAPEFLEEQQNRYR
jgi:hypothetical protein